MENSVNRPKVFLSHSSLDKPFINRLNDDLKKCRIDTWLDTEEIRDGRSWMKVIFQDGIPACDAILVYLTPNSVRSKMVEREMDAALLSQLESGGVVVLPYVSSVDVRNQLRLDLRSVHCREWDEQNYHDVLPSVVAEIWHSYIERIVGTALLNEKNKRLELELELNKWKQSKESQVFSEKEEKDFNYIFTQLTESIEFEAQFHTYEQYEREIFIRDGVSAGTRQDLRVIGAVDRFSMSILDILLLRQTKTEASFILNQLGYDVRDLARSLGFPKDTLNTREILYAVELPRKVVLRAQIF